MSYYEDYQPYVNEKGIIDFSKVPAEVIKDIMPDKNALMIFYKHIDRCIKKLGELPVVAKMLYSLYEYDKTLDKAKYQMPDFSKYEKGEAAETIFEFIIDAAESNFENYIAGVMQKRYNGSKPKDQDKQEYAWQRTSR